MNSRRNRPEPDWRGFGVNSEFKFQWLSFSGAVPCALAAAAMHYRMGSLIKVDALLARIVNDTVSPTACDEMDPYQGGFRSDSRWRSRRFHVSINPVG